MVLLDILPLKTPKNEKTQPGIYIMQNTMVRGGGEWSTGEKKLGVREKNEKGGKLH